MGEFEALYGKSLDKEIGRTMSKSVHSATGRVCSACGKPFKSVDLTLRIRKRDGNLLVHNIVCQNCWNSHYEEGEK